MAAANPRECFQGVFDREAALLLDVQDVAVQYFQKREVYLERVSSVVEIFGDFFVKLADMAAEAVVEIVFDQLRDGLER